MVRHWCASEVDKEVLENYQRYLERKTLYKSFGYDVDKERAFIIEKAQPIFGDILEVGTGKGHFALALAKEGYRFISVDISKEEQRIAKLNLRYFGLEGSVDFRIENAENLSFQDKSFDIIFAVNALHHFINPYRVIDELVRLIKSKGKIILSDFTKEGLEFMDKIHTSEGRKHEVSNTTLADIERYLIEKSFKIDKASSKFQEVLVAYHQLI